MSESATAFIHCQFKDDKLVWHQNYLHMVGRVYSSPSKLCNLADKAQNEKKDSFFL